MAALSDQWGSGILCSFDALDAELGVLINIAGECSLVLRAVRQSDYPDERVIEFVERLKGDLDANQELLDRLARTVRATTTEPCRCSRVTAKSWCLAVRMLAANLAFVSPQLDLPTWRKQIAEWPLIDFPSLATSIEQELDIARGQKQTPVKSKRGRRRDTDPDADARLAAEFKKSGLTYTGFAARKGVKPRDVKLAIDRARKRRN
ncbi:MAG TPA: hypothetical protein VKB78_07175 [Pirellulales bacterium]|nr:hypothetical protein [Pirellulales bacterium]